MSRRRQDGRGMKSKLSSVKIADVASVGMKLVAAGAVAIHTNF